jgi:vancomycin permeability regulator SanA
MISNRQNKWKACWKFLLVFTAVFFLILLGTNLYVISCDKNRMFTQTSNLPQCEFEMVMGTEPVSLMARQIFISTVAQKPLRKFIHPEFVSKTSLCLRGFA